MKKSGLFTYVRYTSKRTQHICKICALLFDKKSRHTFMVCAGSAVVWNCGTFCRMRRDFYQTRHIFMAKGALRCIHHSAVLLAGEKRCTCHLVFECYCGAFVAFFLTYIVKNEKHFKNEQKVGLLLQKRADTVGVKKVPPFDPYNGRPLKKNGRRTGIER